MPTKKTSKSTARAAKGEEAVRVFAVVPAAGRSRRMGRDKQLLEIDGQPMLRAMLEPLLKSGVVGAVVVTHAGIATRIELADLGYVVLAINDDESSEMIDSVRLGLRAWRVRAKWSDRDGILVCPADQPGIPVDVFRACIAAFAASPQRIVVAARAGRRGHPLIFPASLVPEVESDLCDQGLHALAQEHAERVEEVPCEATAVTHDVDTPEDYERAVE